MRTEHSSYNTKFIAELRLCEKKWIDVCIFSVKIPCSSHILTGIFSCSCYAAFKSAKRKCIFKWEIAVCLKALQLFSSAVIVWIMLMMKLYCHCKCYCICVCVCAKCINEIYLLKWKYSEYTEQRNPPKHEWKHQPNKRNNANKLRNYLISSGPY